MKPTVVMVTKLHTQWQTRQAQAVTMATHSMWECTHDTSERRFFAFVSERPRGPPVQYFPSEVIKQVCVMTEQPADEVKQTPGCRLYPSSMTHDLSSEIHLNKWSRLTTLFISLYFLLSLEPHGCWQRWVTESLRVRVFFFCPSKQRLQREPWKLYPHWMPWEVAKL